MLGVVDIADMWGDDAGMEQPHRLGWVSLVVVVLVVAAGCSTKSSGTTAHPQSPRTTSVAAREYLASALELLHAHSLDVRENTWPSIVSRADQVAQGAQTTSATYPAIALAISLLHDRHTEFRTPQVEAAVQAMPLVVPKARLVDGRYAVLTVPHTPGPPREYSAYLRHAVTAERMVSPTACGYVVDLRGNRGGDSSLMMTAVAPLLDPGTVGYFVNRDGSRDFWSIRNGRELNDGKAGVKQRNPIRITSPRPPVAILTDGVTGSAAEATEIAFHGQKRTRTFGLPTAGVASGNVSFTLSDGAILLITEAQEADRFGHVFANGQPIKPDVTIEQDAFPAKPGAPFQDHVLKAALHWLSGSERCQVSTHR
jgi:carboxyl-terminal processing protease